MMIWRTANSKAFQIAVEEEKLGTWKLYKKLVLKNRTG
ncbi:C-P lyase regulatory protein [Streptococcus suis 05ZYH33]|nr:C-P lyase regulatory protein [Streptococcus suis 05ZYH33]